MLYPDNSVKANQVLVLRRLACAGRVLAGRSLCEWLRGSLHNHEHADEIQHSDGTTELHCIRPGATFWRRVRGLREARHLLAWIDADADRLTIQEWTGSGLPLPCLRQPSAPQGGALPIGAQVA